MCLDVPQYTPIHGAQAWWHSNVSAYFLKLFFMNWIQYAKLIVATIVVGHQLRANKYGIGIHNNSLSVPFVDIAELCEIVFGFDNSSMSHSNKLYSPSKEFKGGGGGGSNVCVYVIVCYMTIIFSVYFTSSAKLKPLRNFATFGLCFTLTFSNRKYYY